MIFASHGHLHDPSRLPSIGEGDIFLYGHTHVPECREENGIIILNPGSVSIPKQDSEHGYMTLFDNTFEWKTLDGVVYKKFVLPR